MKKQDLPKYAITIARIDKKGKTLFQTSAGADDLDLFTKTDLLKFIKHFKKQMQEVEGKEWPTKK